MNFKSMDLCKKCKALTYYDSYKQAYRCTNDNCNYLDTTPREQILQKEKFLDDPVNTTNVLIKEALGEYDRKFKAFILLMIQKKVISNFEELEDVLKSMDLLDVITNDKEGDEQ